MRRVYYSYTVSVMVHPMMWRGVFLSVAALMLAEWLHVASIINNLLSVQVGAAPQYMYGSVVSAATSGELMTVLTLLLAGGVAVSAGFKLAGAIAPRLTMLSRA